MKDQETRALSVFRKLRKIKHDIPVNIPNLPNLFIGSIGSMKESILKELGITHVIAATQFNKNLLTDITYLRISIEDQSQSKYKLKKIIPLTNTFIKLALNNNNDSNNKVLVHCFQGISRASTIIIAYMLQLNSNNFTVNECLDIIKEVRPQAEPNDGFIKELRELNQENI